MSSQPLLESDGQISYVHSEQGEIINSDNVFDHPIEEKLSMGGCFLILVNTAIGSGTLLIPYCYTSGVFTSLLISLLFGIVSYIAMTCLIESGKNFRKYDYHELFAHCFGERWMWIPDLMIFLVQFGSAMIYAHWNGRLLNRLIGSSNIILGSNVFWVFATSAIIAFPLTIFKDIQALEKLTALSFVFIIILIVHATFWLIKDVSELGFDPRNELRFFNFKRYDVIITAFGVNSMAYNCHINVFSCIGHMKNCTFKRCKQLSIVVVAVAFLLYNMFGMITYFDLFDTLGNGSSLEYYPPRHWFTIITIIGVVIVLIISAPLVLWAARYSVNRILFKGRKMSNLRWIIIGGSMCIGAALLAASSDNVLLFFDLVGGLFTPTIIFLMPGLFFVKSANSNTPLYKKIAAYFIILFTIVAMVACTYQSISEIIKTAKGNE
ncbi:Transmembrane amino acid transporter protein [Histomonas meleagridis]|uniref:Transmembrane amino acid transporter protein n=1 Tax=Histomonas meleagridis TaxID=135588 RepID=UPI0035598616|nr:Transmembrane amino acid transporter protein [Histomonas meleagridis]KAH0797168.1 Transmembrane amino acid transporter protein [Histomonas meleagridis]